MVLENSATTLFTHIIIQFIGIECLMKMSTIVFYLIKCFSFLINKLNFTFCSLTNELYLRSFLSKQLKEIIYKQNNHQAPLHQFHTNSFLLIHSIPSNNYILDTIQYEKKRVLRIEK